MRVRPRSRPGGRRPGGVFPADTRVQSCTALIKSGRLRRKDRADAYNNRGVAYGGKGDYDRAIADFDKAIQLKPDYADAYDNRGVAYGSKGDYDRAIADYDKAIQLKPDYADAYYNRGARSTHRLRQKGRPRPRHRRLRQGHPTQPELAVAYFSRGPRLRGQGRLRPRHRRLRQGHPAQPEGPGKSATEAYKAAGYKTKTDHAAGVAASRLLTNVDVKARLAELQGKAAEQAVLTKEWVLKRLMKNVERAMQAVPVLNADPYDTPLAGCRARPIEVLLVGRPRRMRFSRYRSAPRDCARLRQA